MNTTSRRTIAIAAVGSTAAGAFLLGSAAPAFAHDSVSNPARAAAAQFTPPTLDQQKTWIENFISYWQQTLTTWGQKVAANDALTDAQKTTYASELASAQQALADLKTAVAAATTEDELRTALQNGWAQFHWPTWPAALPHLKAAHHHAKASHHNSRTKLSAAKFSAEKARTSVDQTTAEKTSTAKTTTDKPTLRNAAASFAKGDQYKYYKAHRNGFRAFADPADHSVRSSATSHTVTARYTKGDHKSGFEFQSARRR